MNVWQEVKERYSLKDVAAEYGVDLRGERGICPLCKYDKKPSLYVGEEFFKCHHGGCEFKGDLFNFVAMLEDCDRWGALKKLAKQAGIDFHQTKDDIKRESQSEKFKALAMKFSQKLPEKVLNYLTARALSKDFIERRLIGYVPPTERGSDPETGLPGILAGRILIPFWQGSQIVYMTGRSLGDEQPKYKNQKGHKSYIGTMRGPLLIITEGIFDQLLAEQAGHNCIGLAGSAQEVKIHRGIKAVLLAFDNDDAGRQYTDKHLPGLCQQCDLVDIAKLPEGCKDLADYMAGGGKVDDLARVTAVQYYIDRMAENPDVRASRQNVFLAMARMDNVDREKNLKLMADVLKAGVKSVRADMVDILREEQQSEYLSDDGGKFRVPESYSLNGKGIIWNKTQIAFEPIYVDKRGSDPRTHEEYYNIVFGKKQRIIPRLAASKSQDLLEFSKYGLPVNSANAVHIIRFLDAWNAANKEKFGLFTVSSQLGWFEDSFVMTDRIIGNDKNQLHYVGTIIQNGSYTPGGTLQGWIDTIKMLQQWPDAYIARFILYAGFASAILEPLNQRPFIIHLCGDTSIGKTSALRIPASIYGNPVEGKAMIRWKNTETFLVRYMENLKNLPLVIDESSSESKAVFESII